MSAIAAIVSKLFEKVDAETALLLSRFALKAQKSGDPNAFVKRWLKQAVEEPVPTAVQAEFVKK
jgi:hypothetical protein